MYTNRILGVCGSHFSSFSAKPCGLISSSVHYKSFFYCCRSRPTPYSTSLFVGFLPSVVGMASVRDVTAGGVLHCDDAVSKRMWLKFHRETIFSIYSSFMLCLASGTLEIHAFRNFISQDVHFLKIFSRTYELAEECADDDDVKVAISELRKNVLEELKVHDSFIQEWGSELVKECPLNPTTTTYTNFLLETASGKVEGLKDPGKLATPFEKTKIAAYTISAMTPCMRLYAFIAKELMPLQSSLKINNPYKRWIDNYASKSFQESTLQIEDLLDKLSVSLTGEELDILEKLYHHSMKLELELFSVQPFSERTIVPLIREDNLTEEKITIFSDFDLTCTVIDSSAILAEIAIITAPKNDPSEGEGSCLSATDMKNTWGALSKKYTQEYEQCIESILSTEKLDKFNYATLKEAVEKVSDFERMANSRVIDSGVLKGLNVGDIKRGGERLILQDGCVSFFQSLVKHESLRSNIHVLSLCWCDDLIKSAFSTVGLEEIDIYANELYYDGLLSTGEIRRKVETPSDKVGVFESILSAASMGGAGRAVYIGDSVGDLLCLVKADIGIVFGNSPSLRRVGAHFGVVFVPLFSALVERLMARPVKWDPSSGVLYTVSCWAEIHAFILGFSPTSLNHG